MASELPSGPGGRGRQLTLKSLHLLAQWVQHPEYSGWRRNQITSCAGSRDCLPAAQKQKLQTV